MFNFFWVPKFRKKKKKKNTYLCKKMYNNFSDQLNCYLFCAVTKLREHWDETNAKVNQRKSQLDSMLADSQQYEAKRAELENCLQKFETRLEKITPVGHTADVLESQLKEQKVYFILDSFQVF